MPKQKFHYYTIRNVLTGEPALVRAKNQAQATRGFFDRRFKIELTTQEDLLKFARADVKELDLTTFGKSVKERAPAAAPSPLVGSGDSAGAALDPSAGAGITGAGATLSYALAET